MKKMPNADFPECVIKASAYPIPGSRLFEALGAAVSNSVGYPLMNKELAQLMGQGRPPPAVGSADSIIRTWFPGAACSSNSRLLNASGFINRICRELPLPEHEWI